MATFIHGIGASENIDSSGERLSIEGMDISSLDKDGVFTYEHELAKVSGPDGKPVDVSVKIPSQVVGKILKAKKIFSDKDCEDDHQMYFWNKCKTPYLYVMGELFDDYTEAAKDLAGKFRYDADRKGQNERPVMNFSVEGGKISKEGIDVSRSVARKITITVMPCNKAAIAEMVQTPKKQSDDLNELFKTESVEIEVFPMVKSNPVPQQGASTALSGGGVPTSSGGILGGAGMAKAQPKLALAKHPTQRGVKLGTTSSGKDVYSHGMVGEYDNFDHKDHAEAAGFHRLAHANSAGDQARQNHHGNKIRLHEAASRSAELRAKRFGKPLNPSAKPQSSIPTKQEGPATHAPSNKIHDPQLSGTVNYEKAPEIKKALDAGSALAAPNKLTQGAALQKESLEKAAQTVSRPDAGHGAIGTSFADLQRQKSQMGPAKPVGGQKFKKSELLMRAEEEYAKWEKREQFEQFMKSRLPHLTKGEIQAIGQTIVLSKSMKMENALLKIAPTEFQHSYVVKKEKK